MSLQEKRRIIADAGTGSCHGILARMSSLRVRTSRNKIAGADATDILADTKYRQELKKAKGAFNDQELAIKDLDCEAEQHEKRIAELEAENKRMKASTSAQDYIHVLESANSGLQKRIAGYERDPSRLFYTIGPQVGSYIDTNRELAEGYAKSRLQIGQLMERNNAADRVAEALLKENHAKDVTMGQMQLELELHRKKLDLEVGSKAQCAHEPMC